MEIGFDSTQIANNTNTSLKTYGNKASPAFVGFSMICSAWIIITNAFVLICFVNHRKIMMKSTFSIQILTLSFNDLMAGISTLLVYFTSFITEVTYKFCIFRFVLFVSAQVVVLFHILGICVYRFLTVRQATLPQRRRNQGLLIVIYVLVIWIVTLIILTSTFLIWGKYRYTLDMCSLNEIFQNNYKTVLTYWFCLFIVPAVFTNVMYLAMIIRLCFYARKIAPVSSYNISAPQPSSSNCTNSNALPTSSETNRNKTDVVDHSCIKFGGEGNLWANKRRHLKATKDTRTCDNEGEEKNGERSKLNSMPNFKKQKQALITIGKPSLTFEMQVL